MSNLGHRLAQLQHHLSSDQVLLLSNPYDIQYLTGFVTLVPEEREALLLVSPLAAWLCHASFSPYSTQLAAETGVTAVAGYPLGSLQELVGSLTANESIELLIDEISLLVQELRQLENLAGVSLSQLDREWLWEQRRVKSADEIEILTQAGRVTAQVMDRTLAALQPGLTEDEVRQLIEIDLLKSGSQRLAFPTIVAFGDHSALPHYQPDAEIKLQQEQAVLLDFGATVNHYRGDMTRTVWFGDKPSSTFTKIEQAVHEAYQAVLELLHATAPDYGKLTAADLDRAARQVIEQAGYGEAFIHTTGHGLGLDIHENLSLNGRNTLPLATDMVITVEPGIYLEGECGYRFENTVVLSEKGPQELTKIK